jgi:hypothetical protein
MRKAFQFHLVTWLATVVFCSCSQNTQPNDSSTDLETGSKASNIARIPAGEVMDDKITFEFAIYYLPTPAKEPLGELDALLKDRFKGFQKVEKIAPPKTGRAIAARVLTNVKEAYAPPSLDVLQRFGRGVSRQQAEAVQGSRSVLVLDFAHSREHVWDGMRSALELASALARSTGGLLWDEETRELFSPDEWDKRRIAEWTDKVPDISKHTVIHAYNTGEYVRAITLGMAKFGLPEIVIDNFSWSLNRNMGHVVNLFAQSLAEGATIKKDGEFDLDIKAIQNYKVRESQIKSLKANATSVALLSLKPGRWEEGDPKNRLIEITFDRCAGPDAHSRQEKMLCALFGWEDSVSPVRHDDKELLEASRRARAKLPALRKAFNSGLAPGEFIQVKATFHAPDGENEWMWVEITSWKGNKIRGLLRNEPYKIPKLHGGQAVDVLEEDSFVEVYGPKIPLEDIPRVTVTFGNLMVNGKPVKAKEVSAIYPKGVPDYAEAKGKDGTVVVTVGQAVENRKERKAVLIGK